MDVARRVFVGVGLAGSAAWLAALRRFGDAGVSRLPPSVRIAEVDNAGRLVRVAEVPSVRKSDAEWRKVLAVDQYTMTRRADTELAFAGEYWNFHGDGLYRCVCCGTALFDSKTKFSSGTGWPSFYEPVARENVAESADRSWGMARTAVSCARCGAHLGHVFEDGPPPGGRRYCVNSVGIKFRNRDNFT
ncbi:MAG: peptide-methionine (R)-S-oxide reductase MsrB [Acidobacteriota bacterium]|nr:peptide-methionine (R)-S-oxide reductase MsrB [Acidobacteriota bacterium]